MGIGKQKAPVYNDPEGNKVEPVISKEGRITYEDHAAQDLLQMIVDELKLINEKLDSMSRY